VNQSRGTSPNASLLGVARSRARLATPALLLDLDAFDRNIAKLAAKASSARLRVRPHAKTHKCTRIAAAQMQAGAIGISVATLREAETMIEAGILEVLVTSPIAGATKIERLVALLARCPQLTIVVDNPRAIRDLSAAVARAGLRLRVLIDLDVGMHRTGVSNLDDVARLIDLVSKSDGLSFAGLQCYSGFVQHIAGITERGQAYESHLRGLEGVISALSRQGIAPAIVSGGGTGTFEIDTTHGLFTECQPGSYALMDSQYRDVKLFRDEPQPFDIALFVLGTVVSNNLPGFVTVDVGVKSFATDGPRPLLHAGAPSGTAYEFCGDEFGRLRFAEGSETLELGSTVEFVAPHCDPTVNLHDAFHCVRGDVLIDIWHIDARGSL
jgi:3-hydroxy-D-aspartate aldolase